MNPLPVISHSEVETFELCERRHYYAFGEKLRRKTLSLSLQRGILGHEVLHIYFKSLQETGDIHAANKTAMKFLSTKLNTSSREVSMELALLLDMFFNTFADTFKHWKIGFVEKEARLDFPDFQYAFTFDLGYFEQGLFKIIDWKFTYDFYDSDMQSLLPQIPRYVGALRALGQSVTKGSYGFIRYRNLKSTDPYDRFALVPVDIPNIRITNSFRDLVNTTKKILPLKKLPLPEWRDSISRTSNQLVCKSCSFKQLCTAELNGSTGKVIRNEFYEINTTYGYKEVLNGDA
jgi:hypothetical protein